MLVKKCKLDITQEFHKKIIKEEYKKIKKMKYEN
jgi:hypothetical protein